jgi:hypothetical protein
MITAKHILESVQNILEARIVANTKHIEGFLGRWERETNDSRVKQWIRTRLRNYLINDYVGRGVYEIYPQQHDIPPDEIPNYVEIAWQKHEPVFVVYPTAGFDQEISHVMDYFRSDAAPRGSLTGLSVPDAIEKSIQWTEQLSKKASDEETLDDIRIAYKDGSFTWVELLSEKALSKETKYMSHCVGDPKQGYLERIENGDIEIYSLRDSANKPHVTFTLDKDRDDNIDELSGKGNQPIDPKYIPYVKKFLNEIIRPTWVETTATRNLPGLFWDEEKLELVGAEEKNLAELFYLVYDGTAEMPDNIEWIIAEHGRRGTINQTYNYSGGVRFPHTFNALWIAIKAWGDRSFGYKRVEQIVKAGGKDMFTDQGTALELAVHADLRHIVELLLKNKASNPNEEDRTGNPIFVQLLYGGNYEDEMVEIFLECPDLDINLKDKEGLTALYYATIFRDTELMISLLKRGADANLIYSLPSRGYPPTGSLLVLAAANGNQDILDVLVGYIDLKVHGPGAYLWAKEHAFDRFATNLRDYMQKEGVELPPNYVS